MQLLTRLLASQSYRASVTVSVISPRGPITRRTSATSSASIRTVICRLAIAPSVRDTARQPQESCVPSERETWRNQLQSQGGSRVLRSVLLAPDEHHA